MEPKWGQMDPELSLNGAQMEPKWGPQGVQIESKFLYIGKSTVRNAGHSRNPYIGKFQYIGESLYMDPKLSPTAAKIWRIQPRIYSKLCPNGAEMELKWNPNVAQTELNWNQNLAKIESNGSRIAPKRSPSGAQMEPAGGPN